MKTTNLDKLTSDIADEAIDLAGVTEGYDISTSHPIDFEALQKNFANAISGSPKFNKLSKDITGVFLNQVTEMLKTRMLRGDPKQVIEETADLMSRSYGLFFYAGWVAHAVMQEKENAKGTI